MTDNRAHIGGGRSLPLWVTGLLWVVASTLGWMAALGLALVGAEMGILIGVVMGAAQWPVLRRQIPGAGWWIATSGVGWVVGGVVAQLTLGETGGLLGLTVSGAYVGATMGALQWLVLRRQMRWAALWIPASGTAWIVAWAVAWGIDQLIAHGSATEAYVPAIGMVTGIVTAAALVWLLRQSVAPEPVAPQPVPPKREARTPARPRRKK